MTEKGIDDLGQLLSVRTFSLQANCVVVSTVRYSCVVQSVGCVHGRKLSDVSASAVVAIFMCIVDRNFEKYCSAGLNFKRRLNEMFNRHKRLRCRFVYVKSRSARIQIYRMFCTRCSNILYKLLPT